MKEIQWREIANTAGRIATYNGCEFVIGILEKSASASYLRERMDAAMLQHQREKYFEANGSFFNPVSAKRWQKIVSGQPITNRP